MSSTRFLDADEPDDDGMHAYYYSGVRYDFSEGGWTGWARLYDDEPDRISVVSLQRPSFWARRWAALRHGDAFFRSVVRALQEEAPGARIFILRRAGYVRVDARVGAVSP